MDGYVLQAFPLWTQSLIMPVSMIGSGLTAVRAVFPSLPFGLISESAPHSLTWSPQELFLSPTHDDI